MRIRIHNTTQDLTVGADGELRLGGHDAPEDQRSAGGLGRTGGRNIRHSVQGIFSSFNGGGKPVLRSPIYFFQLRLGAENPNNHSGSISYVNIFT
jgi:hypothetical protein